MLIRERVLIRGGVLIKERVLIRGGLGVLIREGAHSKGVAYHRGGAFSTRAPNRIITVLITWYLFLKTVEKSY